MTIQEYAEKFGITEVIILEPMKNPVYYYISAGFPKKIKKSVIYTYENETYIKYFKDKWTNVIIKTKDEGGSILIDCYCLMAGYLELKEYQPYYFVSKERETYVLV